MPCALTPLPRLRTAEPPFVKLLFAVPLTGAGTRATGVVRCDQPRALDLGARGGQKLETVPAAIVEEVLARLAPIFE